MTFENFIASFFGSLTAIALVYSAYLASACWCANRVAKAGAWWLPGVKSFRFVIRNIPRRGNLTAIRFRVWLRTVVERTPEISVDTYVDSDILTGERILLPGRQDLPLLCFRFETAGSDLSLAVTDKLGQPTGKFTIGREVDFLMFEYSVRARNWYLFKHDISRIYAVPQYLEPGGKQQNLFQRYLIPMQSKIEKPMLSIIEFTREITVTV
jgi:hypothetical protein